MRGSRSCIQTATSAKFAEINFVLLNGVHGERRMHHRLSYVAPETSLTGGAFCAPAMSPIAFQRRELSCRSDVA
jgi:hypothetical protein